MDNRKWGQSNTGAWHLAVKIGKCYVSLCNTDAMSIRSAWWLNTLCATPPQDGNVCKCCARLAAKDAVSLA